MRSRDLHWDGCLNVRDLGGHPTSGGGETRFGAVIRADSIRQLSEEGWRALVGYGVRTLVDLRGEYERVEDPLLEIPVEVVHAPFWENDAAEWEELGPQFANLVEREDVYVLFLEHFSHSIAASLRAVAEAPEGGVVVHCVGGKDRTGLLAAFLLHVAGVRAETIAADYALSEERLRPREAAWLARAETEAERDEIRATSRTPAAAMVAVFDDLGRRHGSVEGYLRAAGSTQRDFERIRRRLLT
jgi:protein-tyrosine phosphatase